MNNLFNCYLFILISSAIKWEQYYTECAWEGHKHTLKCLRCTYFENVLCQDNITFAKKKKKKKKNHALNYDSLSVTQQLYFSVHLASFNYLTWVQQPPYVQLIFTEKNIKSADTKRTVSASSKATLRQHWSGNYQTDQSNKTKTFIPHSLSLSCLLEISIKRTVTFLQTGYMTPVDTLAHDLSYVALPMPYHSSELTLDPNRINLSFQALRPILSFQPQPQTWVVPQQIQSGTKSDQVPAKASLLKVKELCPCHLLFIHGQLP